MNGVPNFIPAGQKDLTLYSETGKPYTVSVSDEGALQIKDETTGETAGVGGGGGIKICKLVSTDGGETFNAGNMDFETAYNAVRNGEIILFVAAYSGFEYGLFIGVSAYYDDIRYIALNTDGPAFYWAEGHDDITTSNPANPPS